MTPSKSVKLISALLSCSFVLTLTPEAATLPLALLLALESVGVTATSCVHEGGTRSCGCVVVVRRGAFVAVTWGYWAAAHRRERVRALCGLCKMSFDCGTKIASGTQKINYSSRLCVEQRIRGKDSPQTRNGIEWELDLERGRITRNTELDNLSFKCNIKELLFFHLFHLYTLFCNLRFCQQWSMDWNIHFYLSVFNFHFTLLCFILLLSRTTRTRMN